MTPAERRNPSQIDRSEPPPPDRGRGRRRAARGQRAGQAVRRHGRHDEADGRHGHARPDARRCRSCSKAACSNPGAKWPRPRWAPASGSRSRTQNSAEAAKQAREKRRRSRRKRSTAKDNGRLQPSEMPQLAIQSLDQPVVVATNTYPIPTVQENPSGSKNSHEDDGPQAPAIFPYLRDRLRAARATAACWKSWARTTRWSPTPTPACCSSASASSIGWASVRSRRDKVRVLIKKYGTDGTHLRRAASSPRAAGHAEASCPTPEPVYVRPSRRRKQAAPAEAAAAAEGGGERKQPAGAAHESE